MDKTIYIDWSTKRVVTTTRELEDLIESYAEDMKEDKTFAEYLDQNYFITEVFEMDEEQKHEVEKEYHELMRLEAIQILKRTLEPIEVSFGGEINVGQLYKS